MTNTFFILQQNVYKANHEPITVEEVDENNVSSPALQRLIDSAQGVAVGVAATYPFATLTRALVVHFFHRKKRGRTLIQDQILCNPDIRLYGYRIDRIALGLYLDLSLRINAAVDILATMDALGGEPLTPEAEQKGHATTNDVALQAWAAYRTVAFPYMASRFAHIPRIATDTMPDVHLSALAKISRDAEILEYLKPTKVVNTVKDDLSISKAGNLNLECTRFRTRIMQNRDKYVIHIETQNAGRKSTITGRAQDIDGRQAHINVQGAVHTSGKVLPEAYRESVLTHHPFFCSIWAPSLKISWPLLTRGCFQHTIPVERILSQADRDRVLLIQGPPGTGKTTVIAASVDSIVRTGHKDRTVWLVAHSNVAVKNIAEKLDKAGFREFKLLVSKDFHYDWHEHLYERLEHCFIRSDMLKEDMDAVDVELLLLDAYTATKTRVILCTLSMLSNLCIKGIALQVPVETVIFDEASQIEVGDYLPLLQRFQPTLRKMTVAPFGQDDVGNLRSVFEFPHLRKRAHFLDTQCKLVSRLRLFVVSTPDPRPYATRHRQLHFPSCIQSEVDDRARHQQQGSMSFFGCQKGQGGEIGKELGKSTRDIRGYPPRPDIPWAGEAVQDYHPV
ncbi:hypothetical protein DFJ58DRAFT_807874 [Suillus subalutaceus]|uniref:uncharacterized protein n=1 Tax=Suillus subalutaceus TaxID=48586 RepID=UPI001B860DE8|nr:uncharacterized protein DFJ58DRAFT_807874 [Suillus subalutaceus]KAG1841682.1 hypothetical protein DFJ58DRAFT_807874 [Suillus subalutaceus]